MNELYIDLDRLPEYHASAEAQRPRRSPEFHRTVEQARASDFVDSESVAQAKRQMLDLAYRQFLIDNYTGTEPLSNPRVRVGGCWSGSFAMRASRWNDLRCSRPWMRIGVWSNKRKRCGLSGRHSIARPIHRHCVSLLDAIASVFASSNTSNGSPLISFGRQCACRAGAHVGWAVP